MRNAATVADLRAERIKHNNEVFREANERIWAAADRYEHALERIPFLCECAVEDCVQIVRLREQEYAAIRADPSRFVTAVGHEDAEKPVGVVVERNESYVVVEKQ